MKEQLGATIEGGRLRTGRMASEAGSGPNGAFELEGPLGARLVIVASNGAGWEHVSVSVRRPVHKQRCPTWEEMAFVKGLFWEEDETVIEYHVPASENISLHDFTLHLWRPVGIELPRPPGWMVGIGARRRH